MQGWSGELFEATQAGRRVQDALPGCLQWRAGRRLVSLSSPCFVQAGQIQVKPTSRGSHLARAVVLYLTLSTVVQGGGTESVYQVHPSFIKQLTLSWLSIKE